MLCAEPDLPKRGVCVLGVSVGEGSGPVCRGSTVPGPLRGGYCLCLLEREGDAMPLRDMAWAVPGRLIRAGE